MSLLASHHTLRQQVVRRSLDIQSFPLPRAIIDRAVIDNIKAPSLPEGFDQGSILLLVQRFDILRSGGG